MCKKSVLLLVVFCVIVLGRAVYKYVYHEHVNVEEARADYVISAHDLAAEFSQNQEKASKKYLEAIVTVVGVISEIDSEGILLNDAVFCYFSEVIPAQQAKEVHIKGRCIGYDELLEVVKIDQCSFVN